MTRPFLEPVDPDFLILSTSWLAVRAFVAFFCVKELGALLRSIATFFTAIFEVLLEETVLGELFFGVAFDFTRFPTLLSAHPYLLSIATSFFVVWTKLHLGSISCVS
ncbi:MAG: hypothetical protein AABZ47_00425 [Planctomycetota bacterium]